MIAVIIVGHAEGDTCFRVSSPGGWVDILDRVRWELRTNTTRAAARALDTRSGECYCWEWRKEGAR